MPSLTCLSADNGLKTLGCGGVLGLAGSLRTAVVVAAGVVSITVRRSVTSNDAHVFRFASVSSASNRRAGWSENGSVARSTTSASAGKVDATISYEPLAAPPIISPACSTKKPRPFTLVAQALDARTGGATQTR